MHRTLAIALGFSPETDLAPRVVASGEGRWGERILAIAKEHGVPCERDAQLAELIAPFEEGEEIPEELYLVIAKIFACLETVREKMEG